MLADPDDAYANAAHIPGGADFPARWAAKAAAFRALIPPRTLAYGEHPRERIDLFLPDGAARGLAVFLHGGYWRALDRADFSHLAAGPLARRWAVALPSYPLAPEARLAEIAQAAGRAVARAAEEVAGELRLAGHSAGGHLAARLVCAGAPLAPGLATRIARVVPISGLFDLRPLLGTAMNADLRLDLEEARAESPALLEPVPGARVHAWVGADERPEFLRQTALLAIWAGLDAETSQTVEPGRHHFDVIEGLEVAGHPLTEALCGE